MQPWVRGFRFDTWASGGKGDRMSGPFPAHPGGEADVVSLIEEQFERLEERFHRLRAETRQAMQFSAIGSAATIWAHEFNNLITPILNLSKSALDLKDPAYSEKALRIIASNAETLVALSERILNLAARNEAPAPAAVFVKAAVQTAIDALGRDLAKDRIRVTLEVPEDLAAWVDPHSFQQILFNLILNARAAIAQVGEGRLRIHGATSGDRAVISISDTGVGIEPSEMESLFDPFRSSRRTSGPEGSRLRCGGIGLALCKLLIEESEGSLTVESRKGEGTTFRIQLPTGEPPRACTPHLPG